MLTMPTTEIAHPFEAGDYATLVDNSGPYFGTQEGATVRITRAFFGAFGSTFVDYEPLMDGEAGVGAHVERLARIEPVVVGQRVKIDAPKAPVEDRRTGMGTVAKVDNFGAWPIGVDLDGGGHYVYGPAEVSALDPMDDLAEWERELLAGYEPEPQAPAVGEALTSVEQARLLPIGTRLTSDIGMVATLIEEGVIFDNHSGGTREHRKGGTWCYPEHPHVVTGGYDIAMCIRDQGLVVSELPEVEAPALLATLGELRNLPQGTVLRDIDGDTWTTEPDGMKFQGGYGGVTGWDRFASFDVRAYGPFTVVELGEVVIEDEAGEIFSRNAEGLGGLPDGTVVVVPAGFPYVYCESWAGIGAWYAPSKGLFREARDLADIGFRVVHVPSV